MVTLDLRGPRGALSSEKATEICKSVLVDQKYDYDCIILSTWAFSVESAEVVANVMRKLPGLKTVIMADIIAGRPEAEGLAVYQTLGKALKDISLETIDLSDNAVGPKGLEACKEFLLSQTKLKSISFCNCGISAEACNTIADFLLFNGIPSSLQEMYFFNNMSGSKGAIAIADVVKASPKLEILKFSSSRVGIDGGVAMLDAIQFTPNLKFLDLSDATFTSNIGKRLGHALLSCPQLETLLLNDIALSDKGFVEFIKELLNKGVEHSALKRISLDCNELSDASMKFLEALLVFHARNIEEIDLAENELSEDGVLYLLRGIEARSKDANAKLKRINLSSNPTSDEVVDWFPAFFRACPNLERIIHSEGEEISRDTFEKEFKHQDFEEVSTTVSKRIKELVKPLDLQFFSPQVEMTPKDTVLEVEPESISASVVGLSQLAI
jgi:Ran GTPase-activating protein 1